MNPLKRAYEAYDDVIGWRFRRFFGSIGNLIRWFPVIWKDREWDHHYIYEILKLKLSSMAKYFRTRDMWVGEIREAERMELCVRLIERVQTEKYCTDYIDVIEEKYGPQHAIFDDHKLVGWNYGEVERTKEENEAISNESRELMMKGVEKHEQAKRILFTLMERHIGSWWD